MGNGFWERCWSKRTTPSWSMKLSFMPSKEKLCQYGRRCRWKMKEQLATLVPGRDQLVLAAHPANLAFYKIQQVVSKKVLSFYGDRQPLSAENFALYFDMIDAQLLITDSEKPKKRLGSFLLAWLKRHTGLPLLTPASVWDLVRSARNRRFTFTSMKLSFQVRPAQEGSGGSWRNILYLKLFCILQWITGAGEGIRRATRGIDR